jgi:tetratricopeptide (TPR) repeat protein
VPQDNRDDAGARPLDDADVASDVEPTGTTDPDLPDDIDPRELDADVRGELRTLNGPLSSIVAKRLVASGTLLDDDPEGALAHAMVARRLAPRVASVREAVGLAAYHAGEWQTAIAELRTYHRIAGRQTHLAVIADCERALGRPERAVDLYRAANLDKLEPDEAIELLIVASGARADLGQVDAAAAMLQVPDLRDDDAPWAARLRYAYADTLHSAGRTDEAREWFARAADVDDELVTDAAERLLDLDGVVIEDPPQGEDDAAVDSDPAAEPKPAGHAVIFAAPDVDEDEPDEPAAADADPTDPADPAVPADPEDKPE